MHILFLIGPLALKDLYFLLVLWRVDPLLGKDLEINDEKTAIDMQRRDKHTSTTIELLTETMFSTRSVQGGYKKDKCGDTVFKPVWRRGRIPPP
jgi:hypothetical protein